MSRGKRCAPGCECGRHNRPKTFDQESYLAEYRDRPGNREHAREVSRRWREANPGRVQARNRDRERAQQYRDKCLYGLTPEGRARLLADQEGCCYLCGEPLALDTPGAVHVDHDHACCRGAKTCGTCIRGLACEPCNKGIGAFGDDPERMRRVADALEMANRRVRSLGRQRQGDLFEVGRRAVTPARPSEQNSSSALFQETE